MDMIAMIFDVDTIQYNTVMAGGLEYEKEPSALCLDR